MSDKQPGLPELDYQGTSLLTYFCVDSGSRDYHEVWQKEF